eukprot:98650_1
MLPLLKQSSTTSAANELNDTFDVSTAVYTMHISQRTMTKKVVMRPFRRRNEYNIIQSVADPVMECYICDPSEINCNIYRKQSGDTVDAITTKIHDKTKHSKTDSLRRHFMMEYNYLRQPFNDICDDDSSRAPLGPKPYFVKRAPIHFDSLTQSASTVQYSPNNNSSLCHDAKCEEYETNHSQQSNEMQQIRKTCRKSELKLDDKHLHRKPKRNRSRKGKHVRIYSPSGENDCYTCNERILY